MPTRDRLVSTVYRAVDDLNQILPEEQQVVKSLDTPLLGRDARFDSLGLINLLVGIEEQIQDEFNVALTIADERAMSLERSPFRTLGSLVGYVETLLEESEHAAR